MVLVATAVMDGAGDDTGVMWYHTTLGLICVLPGCAASAQGAWIGFLSLGISFVTESSFVCCHAHSACKLLTSARTGWHS